MIISKDTNPEKDLYFIGALLIKVFNDSNKEKLDFFEALELINKNNKISFGLFTLAIDWLFLLDVIQFEKGCIKRCF